MPIMDQQVPFELEEGVFNPAPTQAGGTLPQPAFPKPPSSFASMSMPFQSPVPGGYPAPPTQASPMLPSPDARSIWELLGVNVRGDGGGGVRDSLGRTVDAPKAGDVIQPGVSPTSSETPSPVPSTSQNPTQGSPAYSAGATSGATASSEGGIHAAPGSTPQAGARSTYPAIGNPPSSGGGGSAGGSGTPDEMQSRVSGWQAFQERAKNDPSLAMALFYLGAQIVQPRFGGQSTLGRIGESGVNMLNFLNASRTASTEQENKQVTQAHEGQRIGQEGQRTQATVSQLQTQTRELEERMGYLPQNERDKHNLALAEYYQKLAAGDLEGAQAALQNARAELEANPRYQKAVIDNLNSQSQHWRNAAAKLKQPALITEVEAYRDTLMKSKQWHPELTNPQERSATAELEAWKRFYPGGAKEIASGLTTEQLVSGAEDAYQEALASKKIKPGQSPADFKEDWIRTQRLMNANDSAATDAVAQVRGGGTASPRPGAATTTGGARPPGVPADAKMQYLPSKRGQYWVWPDPTNPSNVLIAPAQ
jgi:hypothetical protein